MNRQGIHVVANEHTKSFTALSLSLYHTVNYYDILYPKAVVYMMTHHL
jgi:hypothetical protein